MFIESHDAGPVLFVFRARLANPINIICLLLLFINIGISLGDLIAERAPRWGGVSVCVFMLIASVSFFSSMSIEVNKDFFIIKRIFIFRELICWQDVLGWRRSGGYSGRAIAIPHIEIISKKDRRIFIPVQPFKNKDLKIFISFLESHAGSPVK